MSIPDLETGIGIGSLGIRPEDVAPRLEPNESAELTEKGEKVYLSDREAQTAGMRKALIAHGCCSSDGSYVHASTEAVLAALAGASAPEPTSNLDVAALVEALNSVLSEIDLRKAPKLRAKIEAALAVSTAHRGCICQKQHRRGYCTEPGCPYASTVSVAHEDGE